MKTMTCTQLGGPCTFAHHGASADDIITSQDAHLKAAVAGGDQLHAEAAAAMKGRWRHPVSGMRWYKQAKADFAALPHD